MSIASGGKTTSVATIGFFDGVHLGHRHLIDHLTAVARKEGKRAMVITFGCHPREVIEQGYTAQLLTPIQEKIRLIEAAGCDEVVVLPFDKTMADMSAEEFMSKELRDHLHVDHLIMGYDNRFGNSRGAGFPDYVQIGKQLGIEVERYDVLQVGETGVGSSLIRQKIGCGEMEQANQFLGRPYRLIGNVTEGYHEGRRLGFPTANITLSEPRQLLPASGVYAVKASCRLFSEPVPAMMNIGQRPTFSGHGFSVEVHVIDTQADFYGCEMQVDVYCRIRNERKFDTPEQLALQLAADRDEVTAYFKR